MSDWLELRVHGVSGTPVQDLLGMPGAPANAGNLQRIGDLTSTGQFWRRTDVAEPRELQAYHWGEYTSQFRWQAFWVLLLPFGVINTAQFMLPVPRGVLDKLLHAVAGSCLRVIGLALSALAFLSLAFITMDLIGWYGIGRRAGQHYAATAVLALLLAAILGLIGRLSRQRAVGQSPGTEADRSDSGLGQVRFYTGLVRSPDARLLHSAAILAMLSVLVAWPAGQDGNTGLRVPLRIAETLLLIVTAVVAVSGDPEGGSSVKLNSQLDDVVRWLQTRVLRLVSLGSWITSIGLLGWTVGQACFTSYRHSAVETLPGFDNVAAWLLLTSLGSLAVLLIALLPLALLTRTDSGRPDGRDRAFRRYAAGLATWFTAAVAVFVGVGYAGAFSVLPAVGNGLWNRLLHRHTAFHVPFPAILRRVLYAWGWTVILALAAILVLGLGYRLRLRSRYRAAAVRAYDGFGQPPAPVAGRVGFRMFCARLKNLVPLVAIGFGASGVLLSIAAGAVTYDWPGARSALVRTLAGSAGGWVVGLQTLGLVALIGLVVGVGLLTYLSYRSDLSRRSLNIVWDVICFWPRSVHPLTPAAYSQFVVAELREHVSSALREDAHRRVVVAAHSQGSLISFAMLQWLSADELERVGFLSFGSQLRQIYPRAFPGYVNVPVLTEVRGGLGDRWTNLYRDTDHIAGPLFSWAHYRTRGEHPPVAASWPDQARIDDALGPHGRRVNGPDWRLLDPQLAANDQLPAADARSENHSNYWLDNSWDDAIQLVLPQPDTRFTAGAEL